MNTLSQIIQRLFVTIRSPKPVDPKLLVGSSESVAVMTSRRRLVATLGVASWLALVAAAGRVLGDQGFSIVDLLLLTCFAVGTPWAVLGFWNALIGFVLLHRHGRGTAMAHNEVCADTPLNGSTAILLTLRNEDAARALRRLRVIKASLDATGHGHHFHYYVLSDSSFPEIIAAEEHAVAALTPFFDGRLTYRRRARNTGFKAGNIRDFCARYGATHAFMLPLDADSLMSGGAIVRMVQLMEAHPRLGILQSLVVGLPATSAFARLFQFGMRHGMRVYTRGFAWWVGDCGPFWGHNALIRIAPFVTYCELPVLPGAPPLGGAVLSHDQVEAVLMRRAGYEVRVLPVEDGSYEENPPTLVEFTRRDLRWCQGNMQYLKLLGLPGLLPVSRFQLVWAIWMFLAVPTWTFLIALAPLKMFDGEDLALFPAGEALALYGTYFGLYLSPKLLGVLDVLVTPGGATRWGGRWRFVAGAVLELGFSFLLGAVTTFHITVFMLGLPFGRQVSWSGQRRDAHGLDLPTAFGLLWPQLVFGACVLAALAAMSPTAALWSLPLTAGYVLGIPFAVATASPGLGAMLARLRLAAVPEELDPPEELAALEAADPEAERTPQVA